jgi:formylglycine-generating enzyme required for sulfatase activity
MSGETTKSIVFYCPQHQLRFRAVGDAVVNCEQGGHPIGFGFPDQSLWQYCCDCATFWPSEVSNGYLNRSDCVVCERTTAMRYVCDACQVVSIESAVPVLRKLYSITTKNGIAPACPGCGRHSDSSPAEHQCRDIGISLLTSREACPFCETAIPRGRSEETPDGSSSVCAFCGALGKPDISFCGRCGKPYPRTTAVEVISSDFPTRRSNRETTEPSGLERTPSFETGSEADISHIEPVMADTVAAPWQTYPPESPPKRRVRLWPVAIVVVITVVIGVTFAILFGPKQEKPGPPNVTPNPPPGMLYVPGGQFTMGNDLGDENEKPGHKVTVNSFFIDKNEVTCSEYEKFVKATNHRPPLGWNNGSCPAGAANNPVTDVDWYDTSAYARWAGKRLPTEEEWEFAARGTDGRIYPWGNEWKANAANAGDSTAGRFTDVGSYPEGKSPFGAQDMIGNAWEWTASDLKAYPGGHLSDQSPGELKVIRGGYWGSSAPKATTTFRRGWDARDAQGGYKNTGFRCARDL